MGSDLYDVAVERWREGTSEELVASAAAHGLDAAGVQAIIARMGAGDRAVELDLYIHQIHPDAAIWCVDHGFLVMTMHAAGWGATPLGRVQDVIEAHFGGFDNINSYDFAAGPDDACFAFSVLAQGSVAGDRSRYGDVEDDFEAPDEDWVRVRLWMAWELGRDLQGASWDSRAWVPGKQAMWIDHMPLAGVPRLVVHEPLELEVADLCALAMAGGRVFGVGEQCPELVCHEVGADDYAWRSEAAMGGKEDGTALTCSADGARVYVTASGGWAARLSVGGDGEDVEALPRTGYRAVLAEDCEGRLFELQTYDDESGDYGGMVWQRDPTTGERMGLVASLRESEEHWGELSEYCFARSAPVGAASSSDGLCVVWRDGVERARWKAEGSGFIGELALSEGGDVLYAVRREERLLSLEAWEIASATRLWSAPVALDGRMGADIAPLPGGRFLAISGAGKLGLFSLERRGMVMMVPIIADHPHTFIHALGMDVEGKHLYLSVAQMQAFVWSIEGLAP
jgi:hypothetical protein